MVTARMPGLADGPGEVSRNQLRRLEILCYRDAPSGTGECYDVLTLLAAGCMARKGNGENSLGLQREFRSRGRV